MMNFIPFLMRLLILISMMLTFLGCVRPGPKTVAVTPTQPVITESLLSKTAGAKIKFYNFLDAREGKLDPYLIGQRTGFGVDMGYVYGERPVVEIVTEAVKSEFTRNGYKVVRENEDFSIKGKILQFWIRTPLGVVTWEAIGEVSLTMEVSQPGQKVATALGPYNGRKSERTATNIGPQMLQRVSTGALMDAIQKMSSDPQLISALSKRQKN